MADEKRTLADLYTEMSGCTSCRLRQGCTQVVPGAGNRVDPILMIIGEAPGAQEDEAGEPFVGQAGEVLRDVLRKTGVIKRTNTLISNVLKCRPPKNKFPKDDCPEICVSKWLWDEIRIAKPKRLLLVGSVPLEYVGGLEGITACRGQWIDVRGIRTMATFHPSFVMRKDSEGNMSAREAFERDINEIAKEVKAIMDQEAAAKAPPIQKEEGKSQDSTQLMDIER